MLRSRRPEPYRESYGEPYESRRRFVSSAEATLYSALRLRVLQPLVPQGCIQSDGEGIHMMSKAWMMALVLLGVAVSVAGCNTVDGVGKDISGSARAVKRAL